MATEKLAVLKNGFGDEVLVATYGEHNPIRMTEEVDVESRTLMISHKAHREVRAIFDQDLTLAEKLDALQRMQDYLTSADLERNRAREN